MDGSNQKKIINAEQQIQVSYGSILHKSLTNLVLLAAKQEPYKKAYISAPAPPKKRKDKNKKKFLEEKSGEWASRQKKDKTVTS